MVKKSFTILELVMVMTITGIVAGSTFQMFMNIYQSYSYIHDIHSLDLELSNASIQIVKYLENREYNSVIDSNETNFTVLSGIYARDRNETLQWVGKAFDTYNGTWSNSKSRIIPNWSGFLDLCTTKENNKTLLTLDNTDISQAQEIIYLLSNKKVNISDQNSSLPAIFFKGGTANEKDCFGWGNSSNSSKCAFVGYFSDNKFLSSNQTSGTNGFGEKVFDLRIYEQYILSWTAYGLKVVKNKSTKNNDLYFYYNYRPWNGETIKDATKIILLQNVTLFKYSSNGSSIILEICIKDKNKNDIEFCREILAY